jgi:molybdenum cofactor cytidylyltransferase
MVPERSGRVAGVLLAAGSSSRLGTNKLLIELGMETVVRRAARQTVEAGLSPVIVVTGFEADRVAAALEGLPLEVIENQDYALGIHASLQAGIAAVPDDCAAAVVVLADMPLVTSAMLAALVARFRAGAEPLVATRYGEVQAPPTLYSRALFPALGPRGEGSGRRVIQRHRAEAAQLQWSPELLADLDRPEDLARLRAIVARSAS